MRVVLAALVSVVVAVGVSAQGAGDCYVGLVVEPGGSCMYPGTDVEFRVDDSGSGRLLFFTLGQRLELRAMSINGVEYTFVASKQPGGGWLIEEIGGSAATGPATAPTTAPPVTVVDASGSFSDVEGSTHEAAISVLAAEGVFAGTECVPGEFCPTDPVERWVMAVWLVRILDGVDPPAAAASRFADVDGSLWWSPYVERLADLGVTGGCSTEPARFCPTETVTRAQMASFLVRAFDLPPAPSAGFADVGDGVHTANIDALAASGVTSGCRTEPLRYCPGQDTTRAQMATFLVRARAMMTEFTAGGLGAVEVSGGEEIQIRSLNTITGGVAFLGIPNQRGVELAIADYGPIAGRSVSLGTGLDDLCSPDGGQASAQAIVADPSIVGVIGTSCSGAAVAASPLISNAGMVMISPSNTSPALTSDLAGTPGSAYQPGYFRTAHNDLFQGRAVALFVRNELSLNRAAAIHDGDPYTQGLAKAFADAFVELGGEVTTFTAVNKGDTDMTAVLTEVSAGGPQAVFFPIFMPEGGFIVQQVGGVSGLDGVTLIAADGLLTDNFMELPESEGVYMSGPDLRFGSNRNSITGKTADEFLAAYEAAYGEVPSAAFWAHAYDATTMLLRAVDRVAVEVEGTLYVDRQALRDELYRSNFDGMIGAITCDEYGDCGSQLITVVHHTDSRDIEAGKTNVIFRFVPTEEEVTAGSEGTIVFDSQRNGNWDVFAMNADGTGQQQLTDNTSEDRSPGWSPDGTRIAFTSDRDGDFETFVMNADGTGRQQLTDNTSEDRSPGWSPDGTRIVFASDRDGDFEVFVMNADGTGRQQLTDNTATDLGPGWSPDGTRIVFASDRDGDFEIFVMNADGTGRQQLTDNTATDLGPGWSPDGTRIVFASDRDGEFEVFVMNADGTNQQQLTDNTATDLGPGWSPDGTRIVFASDRDGEFEVFVMNADGTNQQQLTYNHDDEFVYGLAWSSQTLCRAIASDTCPPSQTPIPPSGTDTTAPPTTTTPDANVTGAGQPDPTMCRPMGTSGITAGFPLPSWAMPSVGSIQVAVLFVDFPDIPATRSPDDEAEIFLPFAEEYLESVSYGKLDLEFVLLRRWLRVENNHDFYLTEGRLGIGLAINGEAARLADPEFDFTGYEGIMIVMPGSHFTGGNALGSSDTDEGTITTVRMNTFVSEAVWDQGRVAAHELAHHFGLLDFYPYDFSLHQLRSAPEGKAWVHTRIGLMGLQVNFLTHPQDSRLAFESRLSDGSTFTYYSAFLEAFEMLAWSRWQLGWLDQTQIRCVSESETTVSLSPVADPTDGIVMVAVPLSQTEVIVMESRRKIGYDATRETQEGNGYVVDIPALPAEGVLVYTVNAALGTGQLPVKVAGDTGNGQVDFFPLLTDGQSVTIRGYTITVKSSTSTTHTVTITKAP